jgi:hypothetical protein
MFVRAFSHLPLCLTRKLPDMVWTLATSLALLQVRATGLDEEDEGPAA